jgi:hypothetical protein
MSVGLVICGKCKREVHQAGDRRWFHCETKTPICDGADAPYAQSEAEIVGKWCGMDGFPPGYTPPPAPELIFFKVQRYPGNGNRKERRALAKARRKANKS